jgi:hypothetical protein
MEYFHNQVKSWQVDEVPGNLSLCAVIRIRGRFIFRGSAGGVAGGCRPIGTPVSANLLPSLQIPAIESSHRLVHCAQLLLACSFLEFHANTHEKAGLRCIVNQAAPYVVHVKIAVACLQEQIAREIDAN